MWVRYQNRSRVVGRCQSILRTVKQYLNKDERISNFSGFIGLSIGVLNEPEACFIQLIILKKLNISLDSYFKNDDIEISFEDCCNTITEYDSK